jgi:hypothetical protein
VDKSLLLGLFDEAFAYHLEETSQAPESEGVAGRVFSFQRRARAVRSAFERRLLPSSPLCPATAQAWAACLARLEEYVDAQPAEHWRIASSRPLLWVYEQLAIAAYEAADLKRCLALVQSSKCRELTRSILSDPKGGAEDLGALALQAQRAIYEVETALETDWLAFYHDRIGQCLAGQFAQAGREAAASLPALWVEEWEQAQRPVVEVKTRLHRELWKARNDRCLCEASGSEPSLVSGWPAGDDGQPALDSSISLEWLHSPAGGRLIALVKDSAGEVVFSEEAELEVSTLTEHLQKLYRLTSWYYGAMAYSESLSSEEEHRRLTDFRSRLGEAAAGCHREISRLVISPALAEALSSSPSDVLVVSPHRELNYVPWEVMSAGGVYLGLRFGLSRIGGERLLQALRRRDASRRPTGQKRAIIAYDLVHLDEAKAEAKEVEAILLRAGYGVEMLCGDEFTGPTFRRRLESSPFDVVYYVGHGSFCAEDPMLSWLHFDLKEPCCAGEVASTRLPACPGVVAFACTATSTIPSHHFSVLNACHTARADHTNNELTGFARGWLRAGSSFMLGGNWALAGR